VKELQTDWPLNAARSSGFAAAVVAAMLLCSPPTNAAAVIVNPSFETGATFEDTGWQSFQTFITGIPVIVSNGTDGFGSTPFGNRYIAMYNPEIGGGVYQTVSGLAIGLSYELRFWGSTSQFDSFLQAGVFTGAGSSATVVAAEIFFVISSNGFADFSQWQEFVLPFTATATDLNIGAALVGVGQGPVQFGEGAVDHFSIIQVPEPSSLTLVGLAIFFLRRRRPTLPNPKQTNETIS
jgi:hypothetical protein